MNAFPFLRLNDDSLVVVQANLSQEKFFVAIDTGASHTTLDLNILHLEGFSLSDAVGTAQFSTGKGILDGLVFELPKFSALGITKKNFRVCAYDFLAHQLFEDFDGLLGLDFFDDFKICFDFRFSEITLT